MHRTFQKPGVLLGAVIAILVGGVGWPARAQLCTPEQRPLVVLLNGTTRLQMTSRKAIKTIVNPKEGILTIRTIERDPTGVILVGQGPGITRIEMEDADGNRETREVLVQMDVEYLNRQIRSAVPLSSISVIPTGSNSVILTGFVMRAEDVNVATSVAQAVGFNVINGLRLNGVQQVQLDVVVARVRRTKGRDFGFNFLGNSRQTILGSQPGNLVPTIPGSPVGVPSPVLQPTQFGQIINAAPGTAGTLFGGVIGNASGFLGFLQALEREGLAKLLAQPRLCTLSGNPASFLDGGEQAVPVPAGLGQVGVQFEEFGTRLNFLPIVLGNGRIHLEVEPEVSILDAAAGTSISGATVPGRATQRVHTTVEMETGQTFVIGGLIQKELRASTNKVPVIGQVPFLGAFFSTKTMDEVETELVVLVTPHLVDAQSTCQVGKVLPGQETRSPDDLELFLEGILEAPRGPREVFQGNRYVPAHHNGPSAMLYPCAGRTDRTHPHGVGALGGARDGGWVTGGSPQGSCPPGVPGLSAAAPSVGAVTEGVMPAAGTVAPVQAFGTEGSAAAVPAMNAGTTAANETSAVLPQGGALSATTPAPMGTPPSGTQPTVPAEGSGQQINQLPPLPVTSSPVQPRLPGTGAP